MTTPARRFFASRAIDPRIAHAVGVRPGANPNELTFPNGRRRLLDSGKVLQAKGKPLAGWWLTGRGDWETALVCEGESDSLAALTALRHSPDAAGLRALPVACLPGANFPTDRLVAALKGISTALLVFDHDEPKLNKRTGEYFRPGQEAAARASEALSAAGIRPIIVPLPEEGTDLAGWLTSLPSNDERGNRLANLLIDAELEAPSLEDWQRSRQIDWHRRCIATLEAEGVRA